jgi:hypothetical protein
MSQQLISHSPDLKKLRDEGYEIEILYGYLLVHHIPYLSKSNEIGYGTLVSSLTLSNNNQTARPDNHIVYFKGDHPCDNFGNPILTIAHSSQNKDLGGGIIVNHSFSNKPIGGYSDYYEKITVYLAIISGPAKSINDKVSEKTFKVVTSNEKESVFQYIDTNSSRANISAINSRFSQQRIGIVGLGGTGGYILDLVAKTPVLSIKLFDGDVLLQHNAFRSPGAVSAEQLEQQPNKAVFFKNTYSVIHKYIDAIPEFISQRNLDQLDELTFVFICVDSNSTRKMLAEYLVEKSIPFADVGLGVEVVDDQLIGMLRVTTATNEKNDHLSTRIAGEDHGDNIYSTNIQIADLNALNAAFAVIKWKKIVGFYQDLEEEHHSAYSINISKIFNEDSTASIR